MSAKHFFPSADGVVHRALNSIAARNPHLFYDSENRVMFSKSHAPSKVAIISGGGGGHEPAWSGYVGEGMLSASISGDVFASPSTKQIMAGVRSVPSDAGIILCITNYTGDRLHFGLACEKARAEGHKAAQLPMTDDAALGRKQSALLGRRGLAGNLLVLKLLGAASNHSWSFEDCLELGTQMNAELVTIGTSLDHCHVPGRTQHEAIAEDSCVVGMGIHNEPGLRTISPMPSPEDLIKEMLLYLLDPSDADRAFTTFDPKDEVALLVNNFGGLSTLELEAMTNIALEQLEQDWKIKPSRIYSGIFETSLNGPGFSLTLGNLSNVAKSTNRPVQAIISLLDEPTTAPAWPSNGYAAAAKTATQTAVPRRDSKAQPEPVKPAFSTQRGPPTPRGLVPALQAACRAAIAAEPLITNYDMQLGDGDCGEAVAGVCTAMLRSLDEAAARPAGTPAPFFALLAALNAALEDMGGSLGAILCILSTAFAGNLQRAANDAVDLELNAATMGKAAGQALDTLRLYTGAREGDRTAMDALIPFCETLQGTQDMGAAVRAAEEGAHRTGAMKARFGRAVYVGEKKREGEQAPLDAGAYAVSVFLRGLGEGGGWV